MNSTEKVLMEIHGKVCHIEATMATRDDVTSAIKNHMIECRSMETKVTPSTIKWAKKIGWYIAMGLAMAVIALLAKFGINIPNPPL